MSLLLRDGADGVEDLHLLGREVLPQVRLGHLAEGVAVDVIDDLDGAVRLPAGQDLLLGLAAQTGSSTIASSTAAARASCCSGAHLVPDLADDDEVGAELVAGQADDVLHLVRG